MSKRCVHDPSLKGLAMYIEALLGSAACIGSLELIFCKAEIKPSGLRVNSTAEASAKYSRLRDKAIWAMLAANGPRIIAKIETTIMMRSRALDPSRSSSLRPPPQKKEWLAKLTSIEIAAAKAKAVVCNLIS